MHRPQGAFLFEISAACWVCMCFDTKTRTWRFYSCSRCSIESDLYCSKKVGWVEVSLDVSRIFRADGFRSGRSNIEVSINGE